MIALIWAMDENGLIGRNNKLPWHLPADLAFFKRTTMGQPIIMGRKTYESIGKPLPGRENVIVTRDLDYRAEGCTVVHNVEEATERMSGKEGYVIGGAELFRLFLPTADRLIVTRIRHVFEGDVFFPKTDWSKWKLVWEEEGPVDEKNAHPHVYQIYDRNE